MSRELVARIDSIGELEDGWNGYEAEKFSKEVIEKSKAIAKLLCSPAFVAPTGRGSIQFEYEIGDDYLEIEVFEDHVKAWSICNGNEDKKG